MSENFYDEFKVFLQENYPKFIINSLNRTDERYLNNCYCDLLLINLYLQETSFTNEWTQKKLGELKNQIFLLFFYFPVNSEFVNSSLLRSLTELLLKLHLGISQDNEDELDKIDTISFRNLKEDIKKLDNYNDANRQLLSNFFSLYADNSNTIHIKQETVEPIDYLESLLTDRSVNLTSNIRLIILLQQYLVEVYPKILNLNDRSLQMSVKINLKKILGINIYKTHFINPIT